VTALSAQVHAQEPPGLLVERAEQALANKDLKSAVRTLERLRFQGQLTDSLRLRLAQSYMRQGRRQQAKVEAARIAPAAGGVPLLMLQARLAVAEGNWPRARDYYSKLIKRAPGNAEAYLGLGQALQELGDTAGADAAFANYVRLSQ